MTPFIPVSLLAAVLSAAAFVSPLSAAFSNRAELIGKIEARLDDSSVAESFWGVLIESAETGEIWYERNADRMFVPASNQKILVAAASYRVLGPDFTFSTTVRHTGEIDGEVLRGDLVVVGTGDPTIYDRLYSHSHDVFKTWANELKDQGVRRIAGDIVGDDNLWEDRHVGRGWPQWEITPWYYAEYGPLTFNENYVDITFIPPETEDGELVIRPNVESGYFTLVNEVEVVASGRNRVRMERLPDSNTITLSGRVVAGSRPFQQTPTITNPTLFYATALKEVLEAEGIEVEGDPADCDDLSDWEERGRDLPVLIAHESAPLSEVVPLFMKRSQNLYGENLLHALGCYDSGFGSFEAGRRVVERELEAFGIEPNRFRFSDGSGLSRYNHLSPRMIVAINRGMYESDLRDLWLNTLTIAGVDGTLRNFGRGTAVEKNVRGKTGTLSAVRALSGFVTTAQGEQLLFSLLNNGTLAGSDPVDAINLDVLEMLATFEEE